MESTSDHARKLRQLRWENSSLRAQLDAVTDMLWTMGATRYVELTNPDRAKILRERDE